MSAAATPAVAETAGATSKKPKRSARGRAERRLGLLLCAPAVFVMLAVTAFPIGQAIWLSLNRADLRFPDAREFVGLRNYGDVLTDSVFLTDLGTTLFITVVSVLIELVLGMMLALVMHRAIFGRGFVRSSILIPYGIVTVVGALAWQFAFTPEQGFMAFLFGGDDPFTERGSSLAIIIATEVWKTTPFMALLLLAGLALVPGELHEAAKVDGASAWQRFTRITLPLMKPAILVAVLFRTLDAFRVFDTVYIQTLGANDTETLSILGFNTLINRLNLGLGSAVSVIIFLCVVLIAALFTRLLGANLSQQRGE